MFVKEKYMFEKARVSDVGRVREILAQKVAWMEANSLKQWDSKFLSRNTTAALSKIASEGRMLVIRGDDGQVNSFMVIDMHDAEPPIWPTGAAKAIYLSKFATANGCTGDGSQLEKQVLQWAKDQGFEKARIDCVQWNPALVRRHERHGWEVVGEGEQLLEDVGVLYQYFLLELNLVTLDVVDE